jgi:acyl-CoA dehydrogenase
MTADDWRPRLEHLLADFGRSHAQARADAKASGVKIDRMATARAWHSRLVDHRLAAPGWPESAGGLDLSLEDQLDYYRMTTAAGAPPHPCPLSFILAPTLIKHGTAAQRLRFLDPLLRADEFWCQGFSEPGAGSDLASLSTRAVRDGETYRVTGQKVWTTMADHADWMFALVRTGPAGRSTEGITYLLIPMTSPGLMVRPLRDISGGVHFAEVFFDDVVVPVANRIGEEGQGWSIMRTSLGHERATAFLADEFKFRRTADQVFDFVVAQGCGDDPLIRQRVADIESGVQAIAANSARALAAALNGEDPGGVASVNRLVKSEFEQRLHALALRACGPAAVLGNRSPEAVDSGRWTFGYLMSRASTIGAGTAEIQRNTIAETVLGLPSHRGEGSRPAAVVPGSPLAVADGDEAELRAVLAKALEARMDIDALLDTQRLPANSTSGVWSALVEFGLPGLATEESLGGAGAPRRLLFAAIEESAKALAPTPLVPTTIALALAENLDIDDAAAQIIAGTPAAVAIGAGESGWATDPAFLPQWNGSTVSGRITKVPGAPLAGILFVLATDTRDTTHVLLQIDPAADGVTVEVLQPFDLTASIGTIALDAVAVQPIRIGRPLIEEVLRTQRHALLAVAADSVGVAARALAMAVAWAGEREQFGRPIGSFQAISHRCADMLVAIEGARSQVLAAAVTVQTDPGSHLVDLAAAAAFDTAVTCAEDLIQIHGGIGFTWEHPAHLLLRRAQANAAVIARADTLRDRAAEHLLAARTTTPPQ